MGTAVIRAEGLGKEYAIGAREPGGETFREMLTASFAAPFRRFRRLSGAAAAEEERIWALKDVSFEVAEGEVVGVIGRNGAGKSTLLKILARITDPTEGRVRIRGRVASLLEVGTGFHPELTGRENVYLNGCILGMSRGEIDRKFDEIVAFAEVETFLDTPVKRYSSGMAVRLAFAVAAHLEPEVLLVDEVLAVGDAAFQKKCLGKMQEVVCEGRTILFVSHNLSAIQRICGRALYLENGRISDEGATGRIVSKYLESQMFVSETREENPLTRSSYEFLLNVDIQNHKNISIRGLSYAETFQVKISYRAPDVPENFRLAVFITDEIGNLVFTVWDADTISRETIMEGLEYVETCTVPGKFLQPGRYMVSIELRLHSHGWISKNERVDRFLKINEDSFTQGKFGRPGVIAPELQWSLKEA